MFLWDAEWGFIDSGGSISMGIKLGHRTLALSHVKKGPAEISLDRAPNGKN
jgi:hypothetical protein